MMPRGRHLTALGTAAALLAGCSHPTLNGIVRVTGVMPFQEVVLARGDGGESIPLLGPPALERVAGLEIAATGSYEGAKFRVERFTVVGANGLSATDGTLERDNGNVVLVTRDGGRHTLVSPPPGLRAQMGRRVWVSGPLDREPVAYGVIE
jgi:hypothetical protein